MSYYVYENWTAERKAVIHRGSCGHCKDGQGCHHNPLGSTNGQWHGPFRSVQEAEHAAVRTGKPFRRHRCV